MAVKGRVGHGRYERFVRLGWSERYARNIVSVHEMFKSVKFADLGPLQIDASSL